MEQTTGFWEFWWWVQKRISHRWQPVSKSKFRVLSKMITTTEDHCQGQNLASKGGGSPNGLPYSGQFGAVSFPEIVNDRCCLYMSNKRLTHWQWKGSCCHLSQDWPLSWINIGRFSEKKKRYYTSIVKSSLLVICPFWYRPRSCPDVSPYWGNPFKDVVW